MSFVRDALGRDFLNNQIDLIYSTTSVKLENRSQVYAAFVSSSKSPHEVAASTYDSFGNPIADLPGGVVRGARWLSIITSWVVFLSLSRWCLSSEREMMRCEV